MTKRTFEILGVGTLFLLLLSGCATTGGSMAGDAAAPAAAAAEPSYIDEVGDNGLPTPRAILERYTEALGGKEALMSHTSSTAKGKFLLAAMGVEGDVTIHATAPDKITLVIETAMGNISSGFDGEVGWSVNPFAGNQVLEGTAREASRQQGNFYGPLRYDDYFESQETLEEVDFEGQATYKVLFVDAEGGKTTQYFSKESSLLVGQEAMQDGSEVKVVMSDYKEFGGVMVAGKTVIHAQGLEIENTIDSVTYDDVDPSAFELPESIKSQLD